MELNPSTNIMLSQYKKEMEQMSMEIVKLQRENAALKGQVDYLERRNRELEGGGAAPPGVGAQAHRQHPVAAAPAHHQAGRAAGSVGQANGPPVTAEDRKRLESFINAICESENQEVQQNLFELLRVSVQAQVQSERTIDGGCSRGRMLFGVWD